MEQVGEVTAVHGEWIEVTFCRPEECEQCHGCDGQSKASVLTLRGNASVGDAAVVVLPDSTLVKASLWGYVLPLVGLMAGMVAGSMIVRDNSSLGAAAGGILGLAACCGLVVLTEKRRRDDPSWQPVVTKIIPKVDVDPAIFKR